MLPIASVTNYAPIQSPLINTALPGSAVTHVPPGTVAPSVSNADINNNATANNVIVAAEEQPAAPPPEATAEQNAPAIPSALQQSQNTSVQATFLAQLLAQDGSPETGSILVQYEKLVALGNVKYKPSNAQKPVPEDPSLSFERILQQEHPVVQAAQETTTPTKQPVPAATSAPTDEQQPIMLPAISTGEGTDASGWNWHAAASPQAFQAYNATAARNDMQTASAMELA